VFQQLTLYNSNYSKNYGSKDVHLISSVYFTLRGKNSSEVVLPVAVHKSQVIN